MSPSLLPPQPPSALNEHHDDEEDEEEEEVKGDEYAGTSEDQDWIDSVGDCETDQEIYNKLLQFCGIFRWQNAHGFRSRHYQGLQHIQPKFENIKQFKVYMMPLYTVHEWV